MWRIVQVTVLLSLVGVPALGSAANPSVGLVKASGNFRVDGATVYRNSTVFEGSSIETGVAGAEVRLAGGVRLLLAPDSRSRVFRNRAVLDRGAARWEGPDEYFVEARRLRIARVGSGSVAQVSFGKTTAVEVFALTGAVRVTNGQGVVVANLIPGSALALDPQQDPSPTKLTGRLQKQEGHFLLTDETTKVTVELQGTDLDKQVGKRVELTGYAVLGAKPAAGASQIIRVTTLTAIAPPATGAAAVATAGLTAAAKTAIIGGVAAAATVGGLAASGAFEGAKQPVSP